MAEESLQDKLDREHPFDLVGALRAHRGSTTGSLQESIEDDAQWEGREDDDEEEEDDDHA